MFSNESEFKNLNSKQKYQILKIIIPTMHPLIEFQYWTVTEFVRQLIEGNVISTIGDKNVDDLDKKVLQ